jgi:hypothetical protein
VFPDWLRCAYFTPQRAFERLTAVKRTPNTARGGRFNLQLVLFIGGDLPLLYFSLPGSANQFDGETGQRIGLIRELCL